MTFSKIIHISYYKILGGLRPIIPIKFTNSIPDVLCLLDSGADYSTFPVSIGKKIGIDFEDHTPIKSPDQMTGKIRCKCYKVATSFFVPWDDKPIFLEAIWINSRKASPVLGRIGFFDKFKEVVFCEEEKEIILKK